MPKPGSGWVTRQLANTVAAIGLSPRETKLWSDQNLAAKPIDKKFDQVDDISESVK